MEKLQRLLIANRGEIVSTTWPTAMTAATQ